METNLEFARVNDWFMIVMLWVLPAVALLLAGLAALMFSGNLPRFLRWRAGELSPTEEEPSISVLIPARNEAAGISDSVQAVLANTGVVLEVVVLDDDSSDSTAELVREIAQDDGRVRLLDGVTLPPGWNGKQHACCRLAEAAQFDLLLFLDADVRLKPTALQQLTRRKAQYADQGPAKGEPISLLSAFPNQETGSLFEKILIPMMHYILLCYLPFDRMRSRTDPGYAAGCGQIFVTDREAYQRSGTHAAIRTSRHDGLQLPRIYRQNGMLTDCVDGTGLANCRMYRGAGEVVRGLLKNAHEGIANWRLLMPFTVLLSGANVLPYVTLGYALVQYSDDNHGVAVWFAALTSFAAIILSHLPRWVAAWKLPQSPTGAFFHPLSIVLFLLLQWWAFFTHLCGKRVSWRGRDS
ncbi:glycosyltransferase family 2 protein [Allorhodopirellula solitaria]|nr:glycosyltransferase [Allorhodopirellula solitaria]